MTKAEVIFLLKKYGVEFVDERPGDRLEFCMDDISFHVVRGQDWEKSRWMCGVSMIDRILREAQP